MRYSFLLLLAAMMFSCSSNQAPDVSNIQVDLQLKRFDHDFFSLDAQNLPESLTKLQEKYPVFLQDYLINILGLPVEGPGDIDGQIAIALRQFLNDYRLVKDSSDQLFKDFGTWHREIVRSLKYVKYYFPEYELPRNLITFIGPFDAFFSTSLGIQGDVLSGEGLAIGLQLHMGKDFSFYDTEAGRELYPEYLSATFDPDHIVVNAMKNIVDDLFPPSNAAQALIAQMVIHGRKYYLLSRFIPRAGDHILLGYTKDQLKGANKNEAVIWDFFLNNDLLNTTDHDRIKNYIGPSPKTQEFGEGSPGNLGSFAGLQIVRKFMDKYPKTTLRQLMEMEPREVYELSKYKPRN